jgi:tRNA U34 2-thiouridine synthase MnmA/TrmU
VLGTDPAQMRLSRHGERVRTKESDRGAGELDCGTPPQDRSAPTKIRYKATFAPATITPLADGRVAVDFDGALRDITPGQGAVFYVGDECLGGGIIVRD